MKTIEQIRNILIKDIKVSKASIEDADNDNDAIYQTGIYDESTRLLDILNGVGEEYKGEFDNEND